MEVDAELSVCTESSQVSCSVLFSKSVTCYCDTSDITVAMSIIYFSCFQKARDAFIITFPDSL